ncbi:hypothetical protein HX890_03315 [Pseudomonas gingeri]|uniref:hypothetical protein n=1 Tax=Pseudomonas gingeri TaxID=117681 RepID=UPI0015A0E4F4|nr:hypothetical protein [Pseudomonas gingeri]NWD73153.1 hypothetical protein [Pseudomonas gingeri]
MAMIKEGVVLSGEFCGWRISVDDDREGETGGYYFYLKENGGGGFDYWFEHDEALKAQLVDFEVGWLD